MLAVSMLVVGCSSGDNDGDSTATTLPVITDAGDQGDRLAAARVRWEAADIDDYTWSFTRLCFCPPLTAEVRVDDGEAADQDIDVEFGEVDELDFATMEDLFDVIEHEIEQSDEVAADYVAGTITIDGPVPPFDAYGTKVTATWTDAVVLRPDRSTVELPDVALVNDNWGGAAG